jgi:hypothetical protein
MIEEIEKILEIPHHELQAWIKENKDRVYEKNKTQTQKNKKKKQAKPKKIKYSHKVLLSLYGDIRAFVPYKTI